MNQNKLRVGVIGCGFIAQTQWLHYIHELKQYEMAALCDASQQLLEHFGRYYGVNRLYTDWRELLTQQDIDAVIVLTKCHEEICIAAAKAGKHVLVEKPLCENPQQAQRIAEAVEQTGITLMIGEMKRYDPGFLYAEKLFREMDDIWMIQARDFSDGLQGSYREICPVLVGDDVPESVIQAQSKAFDEGLRGVTEALPGKLYETLLMCGAHNIDLIRAAFGDPQKVLSCEIWNGGDTLAATLDYGPNCKAFFDVGLTNYKWFDEEITAYGKDKVVTVRFPNPIQKNAPTVVEVRAMQDGAIVEQRIEASYEESFKAELVHFFDCVTGKMLPRTNVEVGKKDIELMATIFQVYAKGCAK